MTTLATTSWRRLFTLDHGDRQALIRTELEAWCGAHGVVGAALYSVTTDGFVRLATSGDVEPPSRVEALPLDGWHALELPDGFLLVEAGQTLPEADTGLILLAAAARINVLKREIREHTFQASFRGVELESLYEIGLAIGNTLDLDELGEEVLLRAVSLLDARRGALYLISDDHYRLIRAIGGAAQEEVVVSDAGIALVLDREVSVEMVGEAGEMLGLLLPGATHMLAVPVAVEGTNRGLLIVADKESRYGVGPFPESDRRTLALFANQAAIALENARLHRLALEKERLEREMELAAEIQQQILPKSTPDIAGYEVLGWNRPARQAGGDYFDVFSLAADHWGLVVGDVTGKGLPAAMMVSTLHSALRLLPDRMTLGPELMARLNRHIFESSGSNKFITMVLAGLDAAQGRLNYLSAGHNPGVLARAGGRIEELGAGGLPLGLLPGAEYTMEEVFLHPGDLLCLYSDGITECAAPDDEEYELERLIALLESRREEPLEDILEALDQEVTAFADGLPQGDDQTVVLLRRNAVTTSADDPDTET